MVNWNTKNLLLQSLESLYHTLNKIEFEIFVIDNGSSDGSVEEVRRRFPLVHLIENKENLGFARAVNQGLQQASGRYLLLLNPDTQVKEGAIEKLCSFMETRLEVGIGGAQLFNSDGSKQNSIANYPSLATELLNKSFLRWLFPSRYPGKERNYFDPVEVDSVIGACMIVRREALEQVGLLDEDYFLFLEETDWCYRMKKAGWKVYHLPQAEVIHYQGKSAEQERKRAKVEYFRSRYHFFKKHRGLWQWFILHAGLMIKLIVEVGFIGMVNLLTFFHLPKLRRRFLVMAYLLRWHLKGCPEEMGLKERDERG